MLGLYKKKQMANSPKKPSGSSAMLAPLWQHLSPKAKAAPLAASASLPALESGKDRAAPVAPHVDASCSSPPGRHMAVGSGVAAARRLRTSASSSRINSSTAPRSGINSVKIVGPNSECQDCRAPSVDIDSVELETCPICLDALSGQPLGLCLDANGHRACQHYFHLDCLQRVEGARCPQCRVRFHKRAPLPNILDDATSWCAQVSSSGKDALSVREVSVALKAMLLLPSDDVDSLMESCWHEWTRGEELLRSEWIHELVATIGEHLPNDTSGFTSPQQKPSEDESAKLEDGHTRSGVVCSCGQVHVRRGDRMRRGPVESDIDEMNVMAGQLGTIVHIGDGQESVMVKWDRCPEDKVYCYTWPDPDGLVLAPASFADVVEDVAEVQRQSGLSTAAAEEFLRRGKLSKVSEVSLLKVSEASLRKPPKLFHRVRILPDKLLVQQWFDCVRPCQCTNSSCSGGVQWSSRADKHLGREGIVLKMDGVDDTVLVETRGPCNCQIWYPILALEPVYDPDLAIKPEFQVDEHVECKMQNGWEKGTVKEVLWQGADRRGPCPYSVKLDNGADIFVPHMNLIRKVMSA